MKRTLEDELIQWKNRRERLPILLRGARQVGKSYLVEEFGKKYFEDLAVIDFEKDPLLKEIFSVRDPQEILNSLEFVLKKAIKEGKTLLFLDEIQNCPEAIISLRYFKEKLPGLHIIAAGSLLEFLLHDENFSFPVGRVEFLYLHPFSFIEFLEATSPFAAKKIFQYSISTPPTNLEHQEYIKEIRKYLFVGGMPAAIQSSIEEKTLLEAQRVHRRILQAYESDFGKYAKKTQHKYLELIFQKAPTLITQVLKYSRIDNDVRSRDLKPALDLLCQAGLLQKIYATSAAGLPLHSHQKIDKFKLQYLDIGLLQTKTKVDAEFFFQKEILQINAGSLAEQFVGQELLAYAPPYENEPLLFWERNQGGLAEVDFVISFKSYLFPIEVKAGSTGSLRSLQLFLKEKKALFGIRISEHPLSFYDNVLSVPFYLLSRLPELIEEVLTGYLG